MEELRMKLLVAVGMTLCVGTLSGAAQGTEYYVAPDGRPDAAGTMGEPWDILSALGGKGPVKPGDTIWIRGGKYRAQRAYERKGGGFDVKLVGTQKKPIHVRAHKSERVTLDGGMQVVAPSSYVWLWDLEITVAPDNEVSRETKTTGSHPGDLGAPGGGLNIYAGKGCKFINLVVQDNYAGGVSWWVKSTDGEIYGCIIVNNGWKGPDRNHGHCIYTQNKEGVKTISNCILTTRWGGGQYTMHAYGSGRAYVDNFVLEDNICYDKGTFLVGGGRPSRNIVVRRNYLYKVPVQIGYSAPHNEDCTVLENVVVSANISVKRYRKAVVHNNLIVGGRLNFQQCETIDEKDNRVVKGEPPADARVALLPNKYDSNRANLAIFNTLKAKQVEVKVSPFLKPGGKFRLMHAEDFFGKPAQEGTCAGESITVPMDKPFGAFVLLRTAPASR